MDEAKHNEIYELLHEFEQLGHQITYYTTIANEWMCGIGTLTIYDQHYGWLVRRQVHGTFEDQQVPAGHLRKAVEARLVRGPDFKWPDTPDNERAGSMPPMPPPDAPVQRREILVLPVIESRHPFLVSTGLVCYPSRGHVKTRDIKVAAELINGFWYLRHYEAGTFAPSTSSRGVESQREWLKNLSSSMITNGDQLIWRDELHWPHRFVVDEHANVNSVDTRIFISGQHLDQTFMLLHQMAAEKGHTFELSRANNHVSLAAVWRRTPPPDLHFDVRYPCAGWGGKDLYMTYAAPTDKRDGVWGIGNGTWLNTPALIEHLKSM